MRLGMSGVNMTGQACQLAIMDMKSEKRSFEQKNICQLEVCNTGKKTSNIIILYFTLIKTMCTIELPFLY